MHFSYNQFESKRSDNRKLLRSDAIPDLLATHKVGCESVTEESTLPEANNLEEASYSKRIRLNTSYRNDHDYFSVNEGIWFFIIFKSMFLYFLSYDS